MQFYVLLRDVKLPITSLHYTPLMFSGEGYFRYGRAPSLQAFTGATAKFNMAPSLGVEFNGVYILYFLLGFFLRFSSFRLVELIFLNARYLTLYLKKDFMTEFFSNIDKVNQSVNRKTVRILSG
jgi:hypothetical protein